MAYIRCSGNIGGSLKVRTASGNPCTFTTDLADALVSLTADIVASQDLHGYDHPWAGGAGKNKLNPDYRDNTSNNIKFYNGVGGGVALQAGQAYTISVPNGSTHPAAIYLQDYSSGTEYTHVYSQRTLTYTPSANCNIKIDIYYANSDMPTEPLSSINVQLEKGSSATPYEPYSNICPLVGHSELNLTRCGKNFVSGKLENINIESSGEIRGGQSFNGFYAYVVAGETYAITTSDNNIVYAFYENLPEVGDYSYNNSRIVKTLDQNSFVAPISGWILFRSNDLSFTNAQLELGSTATAYEPYNGTPFTVAFGQTVYGGVYDKSGRLTITHGYVTYDGSNDEDWTAAGGSAAAFAKQILISDMFLEGVVEDDKNLIAEYLKTISTAETWGNFDNFISKYSGQNIVVVGMQNLSDINDFRTYLSNNPLTVAYELATPIVIDVPSISVFAENGTNNIVSDCGGDVNVSYLELIRGT